MIKTQTSLGLITVLDSYFIDLVNNAIEDSFGIKGVSRTGLLKFLDKIVKRDPVKIKVKNNKNLTIDVYVAVNYGTPIAEVIKATAEKISFKVEQASGFKVDKVNMYVDQIIGE